MARHKPRKARAAGGRRSPPGIGGGLRPSAGRVLLAAVVAVLSFWLGHPVGGVRADPGPPLALVPPSWQAEAPPDPGPAGSAKGWADLPRVTLTRAPIDLTDGAALHAWRAAVAAGPAWGVSCAPTRHHPRVVLCLTGRTAWISGLFGRATWFAEQRGQPLAPAAAVADPQRVAPPHAIRGADLPVRAYLAFAAAAGAACAGGRAAVCLTPAERVILTDLIAPLAADGPGRVVLVAGAGPGAWATLSHEWLHGLFFADPGYRRAVFAYWNQRLTAGERAAVVTILGRIYNRFDLSLLVNEFQAHVLQCHPGPVLDQLAEEHAAPLRARLEDSGHGPLPPCATGDR